MEQPDVYNPPMYLRNSHLQTIFNSQGPRKFRAAGILKALNTREITLRADDGTQLLADLDLAESSGSSLVILMHGWEGSSHSSYLVTSAKRLLSEGFDTLRVNLRDHGDSHHLNQELFNSTRSPEVASALVNYVATEAYERIYIVGFSLGGSFALRIAADRGDEIGLKGTIAISPPIDPAHAMDALNQGFFAYERYFFDRWHRSLAKKLAVFPELDYQQDLDEATSLDDLNRLFIPNHTIYDDVNEYFAAYALVGDRLANLSMPTHIITAEDDPIIPIADLDRINANENLYLERHRYGGHCGFLLNLSAHSWVEDRMLHLLSQWR